MAIIHFFNHSKQKFIVLTIVLLIFLLLIMTPSVYGHGRAEVGDYVIIVGWQKEPTIVGERNAIVVQVSENDGLIEGLASTLDAEVLYAGRIFRANMTPMDDEGWYHIELLPTIRGQYTVRLVGTINELEIDELIEPEEVLSASVIAFPESPPDTFALESSLEEMQQQVQNMTIVAIVGLVLGIVGTIAAVLSFFRSQS